MNTNRNDILYMTVKGNDILYITVKSLDQLWNKRPVIRLACAGFADEHWQIFHPADMNGLEAMPRVTIDTEGRVEWHPDGKEDEPSDTNPYDTDPYDMNSYRT